MNRTGRTRIRWEEAKCESKILGTKTHFLNLELYDKRKISRKDLLTVAGLLKSVKPDIIFIPRKGDNHPTHKLCRNLIVKVNRKAQLWEYEGPWSMFEHNEFDTIVAFDEKYKSLKEHAIQCHRSQLIRTRYDVAALALERLRGALVGEEELFGYGGKPLKLGKNIELFNVFTQ